MPHTRPINRRYSVTVRSEQLPRGRWRADGGIFVTDKPGEDVATVYGDGRSMIEAEDRAVTAAEQWCWDRRFDR